MEQQNNNRLIPPKEMADRLQVSQTTVYRIAQDGGYGAVKVRGQWRFRDDPLSLSNATEKGKR